MPIFSLSYSFDVLIGLWYKDNCIPNIKHSFIKLFKTVFLTTDSSTHFNLLIHYK